jgi:hypothetical protein
VLAGAGVKATCIQPGYAADFAPFGPRPDMSAHPALESYSDTIRRFAAVDGPLAARPLDVLFLGTHSVRREENLASYAPRFADLNTFIYYTRMSRPMTQGEDPTATSEATAGLLQRSKFLINIHRDDFTYFEWWRVMQAFWQKCVVVTEPCFPHPLFKPGIHFFEESPRHLAQLVSWLVKTPDGQAKAEEIRANAFSMISGEATLDAAVHRMFAFLDEAA